MSGLLLPVMAAEEAEQRIQSIVTSISWVVDDVKALHRGRAWISLGYESWDELCADRFEMHLALHDRRAAVQEMTEAGMSTRAIGSALGVGVGTVHRDQQESGVPNGTPDDLQAGEENSSPDPTPTTGLDGKTYTRPVPKRDPWTEEEEGLKAKFQLTGRSIVVSMKDQPRLWAWAQAEGKALRIDRATRWGNPFVVPEDGGRDEVISAYRDCYLQNKPSLRKQFPELRGKVLGCWCYPLACHGDVLIAKAYA